MTKSARAGLIAVFIVGVVVRVGWVAVRHGPEPDALAYPDEYAYQLAGRSLAAGTGLIDEFGYRATYMPAYPAFIAIFERFSLPLMWLRLTQAVLAALVAPATFLLARRWAASVRQARRNAPPPSHSSAPGRDAEGWITTVAILAGLAAALDPFLIFFSGLLLTEALFAVALVVTWWLVLRLIAPDRSICVPDSFAAGVSLLACVMLRPSATILILIVPGLILLYRRFARPAFTSVAIALAVVVVGLFPWAARNANLLGEWRWTTTRGGISLYDGLQPGAAGGSDLAHTKSDPKAAGLDESAWDRYWREQAMETARQEPARVLELAGKKFVRMWNLVPNEPEHRRGFAAIVSAIWMVVVLATAALGLWRVRWAPAWWLYLLVPVLAFTLLHMVFVGSVRYRIPLMPLIFVLSAAGLVRGLCQAAEIEPGRDSGCVNSQTATNPASDGTQEDPT